jgi:hypothetical protein
MEATVDETEAAQVFPVRQSFGPQASATASDEVFQRVVAPRPSRPVSQPSRGHGLFWGAIALVAGLIGVGTYFGVTRFGRTLEPSPGPPPTMQFPGTQ